jgi:Golgi nucleoside diphosphatase
LSHASKDELTSLPKVSTKKEWTKKIHPGVSTFGDKPTQVGPDHLQSLINHALEYIPAEKIEDTPIFLMATAGMRLLPQVQQLALTREICSYLKQNTKFSLPDCGMHIQVISGETEGLYGWLAANYLLGGFDHPGKHNHGKGHHTYGFLDMGGASAQIAFAPNTTEAEKHANDLKLVRLRTLNGAPQEYKVFTTTWLGFGVNQARQSYVKTLLAAHEAPDVHEIPDPCMPKGLRTTVDGDVVSDAASKDMMLVGTGQFDECLRTTYPLLGKEAPCLDEPCLLNGQHVPAIDFDVNHFIGVSEYWHTTHGVFGTKGDKAYDFATYQKKVKDFCSQDWYSIEAKLGSRKDKVDPKVAQEACFKASWLINVLHDGIGVPRIDLEHTKTPGVNATSEAVESANEKGITAPFKPVDKIEGIEVSWTLGKMLLYAAGQVPPKTGDDSLPVGFGSNEEGTPKDFQFAGSSWQPVNHGDDKDDDDWTDTAEDLMDKAKSKPASGFLIFVIVIVLLFLLLRKKERRIRLYGKLNSLFRRSRRPGSPRKGSRGLSLITNKLFGRHSASYERVMEEGEASQFELGEVESDENDYSDSSEGSRRGRTSGLATPSVNVEMFDSASSGSALDRSGLTVRTESREQLVPSLQMLNAGRRSRAASPTRLKSPLMSPMQLD